MQQSSLSQAPCHRVLPLLRPDSTTSITLRGYTLQVQFTGAEGFAWAISPRSRHSAFRTPHSALGRFVPRGVKAGGGLVSFGRTSARLKGPPRHRGEEHLGPEYHILTNRPPSVEAARSLARRSSWRPGEREITSQRAHWGEPHPVET